MKPLRIFVVDDDIDFAEGLAEVLEIKGHEVEIAFSAEEAVRRFRECDFDLAFIDIKMPGKNGVEALLEIRRIKPGARVIMMTGHRVGTLAELALERGASGLLNKPFDMDEMLRMVETVPSRRSILIVDDDADFSDGIRRFLAERGRSVEACLDGETALKRLRSGGVDVLVLDLRLPGISGLEVFEEARRISPDLPVIVITGYSEQESAALASMRSGRLEGLLRKPFDPGELVTTLDRLDERKESE